MQPHTTFANVQENPDSKVRGAKPGPIWGRQDSMTFVIWDITLQPQAIRYCLHNCNGRIELTTSSLDFA